MEALPDGQIRPSRWGKLGSYLRDFWSFNLFGRFHFKVAFRAVSGSRPAWLPGLFKSYDPLFQYSHRGNEAAHLRICLPLLSAARTVRLTGGAHGRAPEEIYSL